MDQEDITFSKNQGKSYTMTDFVLVMSCSVRLRTKWFWV